MFVLKIYDDNVCELKGVCPVNGSSNSTNRDFYSKFIPNRLTALCQGKVLSGKLPVVTDNDRSSDAEYDTIRYEMLF